VNASYTSFNQPATTGAATVISNRHYLSAGGQSIGVLVSSGALPGLYYAQPEAPALSSISLSKVEYWHKDHLGSIVASTDHSGAVTARYAYDPFGKRRYTNGTYDAFGKLAVDWSNSINSGVDRGYTGHEHLDDIGIIHMNGRLFEPRLGRFLQADPHVTDPYNLQNYNRYGYCNNNPLNCTDLTGFDPWGRDQGSINGGADGRNTTSGSGDPEAQRVATQFGVTVQTVQNA